MYQATIKLFRICMMIAAFGLFFTAAPAFATHIHDDPGAGHDDPPATTEVDCSSGYYKNHTEVWDENSDAMCCTDAAACDAILANLEAKGPGGSLLRMGGKVLLDACFADQGISSPCDEETAGGGGH